MNTVVYTCITGKYDELSIPKITDFNTSYICFTDDVNFVRPPWEFRDVRSLNVKGNKNLNRYVKMHPHVLLKEYTYSLYIDGSIGIVNSLQSLIDKALKTYDIALYEHPVRNCLYEEAEECIKLGHVYLPQMQKQLKQYEKDNFPHNMPFYECGVIFRRHNSPSIIKLMNDWWKLYNSGVKRDQLSFSFLVWKNNVGVQNMGVSDFRFVKSFFSHTITHPKRNLIKPVVTAKINSILKAMTK
jgi:hypothetical protein